MTDGNGNGNGRKVLSEAQLKNVKSWGKNKNKSNPTSWSKYVTPDMTDFLDSEKRKELEKYYDTDKIDVADRVYLTAEDNAKLESGEMVMTVPVYACGNHHAHVWKNSFNYEDYKYDPNNYEE